MTMGVSILMCGPLVMLRCLKTFVSRQQLKVAKIFCQSLAVTYLLSAVANQQAKYLAKKMNLIAKDKEHQEVFEFHNAGSLAYIGDWSGFFGSIHLY